MKAATISEYAGNIEITDVPTPAMSDDSVLIEVHAASLNPIDNIVRAGHLKDVIPITFPYVMGYDISGTVVDTGKNVTKFKIGDDVFARPNQDDSGSIAEFAVVKENELAHKPPNISHADAASIPLAGLTAWQALVERAGLQEGQTVLIHAGSGGVGTLAIQIAKNIGANVVTTTSQKNADLVRSLGADQAIDYTSVKFEEVLSNVDVVLDMLGGETLAKSFRVVRKGGCVISIKGQDEEGNATKYGVRFEWLFMNPSGDQLEKIGELIADGAIRPIIDSVYPMAKVSEAYDHLAEGHAVGKIVVMVK